MASMPPDFHDEPARTEPVMIPVVAFASSSFAEQMMTPMLKPLPRLAHLIALLLPAIFPTPIALFPEMRSADFPAGLSDSLNTSNLSAPTPPGLIVPA